MDHIVHTVLRFDRFAVDLARGCLRAGDQEIDLRPKTFEVLRYLAQNAGRLVRQLLGILIAKRISWSYSSSESRSSLQSPFRSQYESTQLHGSHRCYDGRFLSRNSFVT